MCTFLLVRNRTATIIDKLVASKDKLVKYTSDSDDKYRMLFPITCFKRMQPWIHHKLYFTVFLHLRWIWTDYLTSPAALVGPAPQRHSLYPRAQHVENIFSFTFLGLTEFSQGNMKVQAVLKSVIPAHLLLLAGLKQTIKLNMIACEKPVKPCATEHRMISENGRASTREGGINQMSHLDWDSCMLKSPVLLYFYCNSVSPISLSALWQTRECNSSMGNKITKRQIQTHGQSKIKCVPCLHLTKVGSEFHFWGDRETKIRGKSQSLLRIMPHLFSTLIKLMTRNMFEMYNILTPPASQSETSIFCGVVWIRVNIYKLRVDYVSVIVCLNHLFAGNIDQKF